jgi:HEAT repeat protein
MTVALLTALGMQPPAGVPEDVRDSLRGLVTGKSVYDRKWTDTERCHALTAVSRLGLPGCDALALRAVLRRGESALVVRAACIALGARAAAMHPDDRGDAIGALLRGLPRLREPLTVGLTHLALGRLAQAALRASPPEVEAASSATSVLRADLRDGAPAVRGFTAIALGLACRGVTPPTADVEREVAEATRALRGGLVDTRDDAVRGAFAVALGLCGDASAVVPLMDVVRDSGAQESLRGHAAVALGQIGRMLPVVVRVVRALSEEDRGEELRRQSALALTLTGAPRAAARLLEELRDADTEHALAQAAVALARLDDLAAVDPLLELAQDRKRSELAQSLAVASLGLLVDPEPKPTLHLLSSEANYPARTDALHEAFSIL